MFNSVLNRLDSGGKEFGLPREQKIWRPTMRELGLFTVVVIHNATKTIQFDCKTFRSRITVIFGQDNLRINTPVISQRFDHRSFKTLD